MEEVEATRALEVANMLLEVAAGVQEEVAQLNPEQLHHQASHRLQPLLVRAVAYLKARNALKSGDATPALDSLRTRIKEVRAMAQQLEEEQRAREVSEMVNVLRAQADLSLDGMDVLALHRHRQACHELKGRATQYLKARNALHGDAAAQLTRLAARMPEALRMVAALERDAARREKEVAEACRQAEVAVMIAEVRTALEGYVATPSDASIAQLTDLSVALDDLRGRAVEYLRERLPQMSKRPSLIDRLSGSAAHLIPPEVTQLCDAVKALQLRIVELETSQVLWSVQNALAAGTAERTLLGKLEYAVMQLDPLIATAAPYFDVRLVKLKACHVEDEAISPKAVQAAMKALRRLADGLGKDVIRSAEQQLDAAVQTAKSAQTDFLPLVSRDTPWRELKCCSHPRTLPISSTGLSPASTCIPCILANRQPRRVRIPRCKRLRRRRRICTRAFCMSGAA